MPTTKPNTNLWTNEALVAAAGDITSAAVVLDDGYAGGGAAKITNEASPPTIAAQVQMQIKQDTEWYDFGGAFVAGLDANGVYSFPLDFPIWVKNARLVAGSNTVEDAKITADLTEVSAI